MPGYVTNQPDFYDKDFTEKQYIEVLNKMAEMKPGQALCVTSKGLDVVGRIWQIVYRILGFFGCERPTKPVRVTYEFLKFLYYGAAHNFFIDSEVKTAVQRVQANQNFLALKVQQKQYSFNPATALDIVANGTEKERASKVAQSDPKIILRGNLQNLLENFYSANQNETGPSIYRVCCASRITLEEFGATYLGLAVEANKQNNIESCVKFLGKAINLNRADPEYTGLLFDHLKQHYNQIPQSERHLATEHFKRLYMMLLNSCTMNGLHKVAIDRSTHIDFDFGNDPHIRMLFRQIYLNYVKRAGLAPVDAIQCLLKSLMFFASQNAYENVPTRLALINAHLLNDENQRVWDEFVSLPSQVQNENLDFACTAAAQWTRNPQFIDHAVAICERAGISEQSSYDNRQAYRNASLRKAQQLLKATNDGKISASGQEAIERLVKAEKYMHEQHRNYLESPLFGSLMEELHKAGKDETMLAFFDLLPGAIQGRNLKKLVALMDDCLINHKNDVVYEIFKQLPESVRKTNVAFACKAAAQWSSSKECPMLDKAIEVCELAGISTLSDTADKQAYRNACLRKVKEVFAQTIPKDGSIKGGREAVERLVKAVKLFGPNDKAIDNSEIYSKLMYEFYNSGQHDKVLEFYALLPDDVRKANAKTAFTMASKWASPKDAPYLDEAIEICELADIATNSEPADKAVYKQACLKKVDLIFATQASFVSKAANLLGANTVKAEHALPYYDKAKAIMQSAHMDMPVETLQQLLAARGDEGDKKENAEKQESRHMLVAKECKELRDASTAQNQYSKLELPKTTKDYLTTKHKLSTNMSTNLVLQAVFKAAAAVVPAVTVNVNTGPAPANAAAANAAVAVTTAVAVSPKK